MRRGGAARVLGGSIAVLLLSTACGGFTQPGPAQAGPPLSAANAPAANAPGPNAPGPNAPAPGPDQAPAVAGAGLLADSVSSALPVQARDVRLVRVGAADLALQFEFFNGTTDGFAPADLGLDPRTHVIATLVDAPRGTGYAPTHWGDGPPRIDGAMADHARTSTSSVQEIPAGGAATVTVMFDAPPQETTSMLVLVDGFLPVEASVQPVGSPALKDDPVLHGASGVDPISPTVEPVICRSGSEPGQPTTGTPTRLRLPSDVLFAFGSAALTPVAGSAIDSLSKQVTATSGTVVIDGHTDAIGDDASNQRLSEQRAASVRDALAAKLGAGFTFRTAGYGETRPVAPNTRPDGSDNPDGRAQNRRVELTVESSATATQAAPAPARDPANTTLTGSGLVPQVRSVTVRAGFALVQVSIRNAGDQERPLGYLNDGGRIGVRADYGGELSLADGTGARYSPCAFSPAWWDLVATGSPSFVRFGSDKVPPGAIVVMWSLFAAPPADRASVAVGVGGFAATLPAPVTAR
ncbi:MAG TPA: OmpA family protein [Pseudonocardia sp.]|nr:OmpA family protein [Pseudonocardia sp.]